MALSSASCHVGSHVGHLPGSFLSGIIGTVVFRVQMNRTENSCREIFRVLMRSWFVILWPLAFLFPYLTQSQRRQESRHTRWLLSSYCPLQASSQCPGAGRIKFSSNKSRPYITSTLPSRTIWAELSRIDLPMLKRRSEWEVKWIGIISYFFFESEAQHYLISPCIHTRICQISQSYMLLHPWPKKNVCLGPNRPKPSTQKAKRNAH